MIAKGGRIDVFLGCRECQAYVEPCVFGEGESKYDSTPELSFGIMYHGITYADEAYSDDTKGKLTINLWNCTMKNGVIKFISPNDCIHRTNREMTMKIFDTQLNNFSGLCEFEEVDKYVMDESAL